MDEPLQKAEELAQALGVECSKEMDVLLQKVAQAQGVVEPLLKAEDVARVLNVGRSKAYNLMASGQLSVVRIGQSVRATPDSIRRYIKENSQEAV